MYLIRYTRRGLAYPIAYSTSARDPGRALRAHYGLAHCMADLGKLKQRCAASEKRDAFMRSYRAVCPAGRRAWENEVAKHCREVEEISPKASRLRG